MIRAILTLTALLTAAPALSQSFTLHSPGLSEGDRLPESAVFNGFGCTGGNIAPTLHWNNVPKGTKSLALTVYDPDAPTGSGWWHWVVFNIAPTLTGIEKGQPPASATQSRTDFNTTGYGGPCPPVGHGPHRYRFTLHALDIEKLALSPDSPAAMVGYMLGQHKLDTATLTLTYERKP